MNETVPKGFRPAIAFDAQRPEPQRSRPPAERVVSGDPAQVAWNFYSSDDGHFQSGIWECGVGKWRVVFTESEFCHLLAGVIVVTVACCIAFQRRAREFERGRQWAGGAPPVCA